MTDATDVARDRMLKLLALAQQGVGGERNNARRFLDKMLAKHGMTEADLTGEGAPERRRFTYKDRNDHDLLVQVLCKVMQSPKLATSTIRGKKVLLLDMTPTQHIEAEMLLSIYRPALAKHLEAALIAFIVKNRITSGKRSDDAPAKKEPDYDHDAAMAMAAVTPVTQVRKQIGR